MDEKALEQFIREVKALKKVVAGMKREVKSLRTDVDKLIENNGGKYGRTA